MLGKTPELEKQQIKALKLTWYTHIANRDKASASNILVNLAAKTINLLIYSNIQSLIRTWIDKEWGYRNILHDQSPYSLTQAIANIIVQNNTTSGDTLFLQTAVERIAHIISCIIADNMAALIPSPAFIGLEKIISHLQHNDSNEAKELHALIKKVMVIDTDILRKIESESTTQQLESALDSLEQLYHAKKAEGVRIKAEFPPAIVAQLFEYKARTAYGEELNPQYNTDYKVMLAHAWELKALYKDTHYIFIHGQKLEHWIYLKLAKMLSKKFNPERDLSLFNLLKLGPSDPNKKSASSYITEELNDRSEEYMGRFLAVDGFLFNTLPGESASYFCQNNINVWNGSLKENLEQFMQDNFKLTPEQYSKGVEQAEIFSKEISQLSHTGNLIVMCIPKNQVSERIYESHPYGKACQENKLENDLISGSNIHKKRLENLQNDDAGIDSNPVCSWVRRNYGSESVAQYRVLPNNFDPEQGDRVFILSPLSQLTRNYFKEKLQLIADDIHDGSADKEIEASKRNRI